MVFGAAKEGGCIAPLDTLGQLDAGEREERRDEVHATQRFVDDGASRNLAGAVEQKRDACRAFVGNAFVESAVFATEVTVIGGEDDDRVVDLSIFSKRVKNAADVVVQAFNHPVILGHQQANGIGGDFRVAGCPARGLRARFVDRNRDGYVDVPVHRVIWLSDGVRPVRVGETDHIAKRLSLVGVNKVDRAVGKPVGGEGLFIGIFNAVIRFAALDGRDAWAVIGDFEFLRYFSKCMG